VTFNNKVLVLYNTDFMRGRTFHLYDPQCPLFCSHCGQNTTCAPYNTDH